MTAPIFAVRDIGGLRALIQIPDIPDDAPDDVREGFARRTSLAAGGTCPCGAVITPPNRAQRRQLARDHANRAYGVWYLRVEHEDDCPALEGLLIAATNRWRS
jgi:hypothetical protein